MPHTGHLIVTIDTEGDNLWAQPKVITTRNAAFLPRFQALCQRYSVMPTWLVDYDMARDPRFVEFGRDVIGRDAGEIGVHPHAWNTPPSHPLTPDDYAYMPYLVEYPAGVLDAKLGVLTNLLEATFGAKMISHRAGRWAFNDTYAQALARRQFRADCSVTPGVDWRGTLGDPAGLGGTDYSAAPQRPYPLVSGATPTLWEVPMTIRPAGGRAAARVRRGVAGIAPARRVWNRLCPAARWLRPVRGNRDGMIGLIDQVASEPAPYLEFMIHSSELMPGGSPTFPDDRSIDVLFDDMAAVFEAARTRGFLGITLGHYAEHLDRSSEPNA